MIMLLVESAGRSLLLFIAVFGVLRLTRTRDANVQLIVWRSALAAALAIPLLLQAPFVTIPVSGELGGVVVGVTDYADKQAVPLLNALLVLYGMVTALLVLRFSGGLIASWRIYRKATPIQIEENSNLIVRLSSSIAAPVTIGSAVLLPMDFPAWDKYKQRAALAHEAAHVRNGDFYWHAAALLHRAVFWINPIAWWLPHRMTSLVESLCDGTAVHAVGDPLAYAKVLLDFSRKPAPTTMSVAMARSADMEGRVTELLRGGLQRHVFNRPIRAIFSSTAIAITAIVACASCEQQATMTTKSSSPNQPVAAIEPIIKPRIDPDKKLTYPEYVDSEKKAGHEGVVFLDLMVDTDGRVAKSRVKKSSGFEPLDNAAEAHARGHWRFLPATQGGKPVDAWVTVPVKFQLTKKDSQPNA